MDVRTGGLVMSHSTYQLYDQCPRRFLFRVGSDYLPPDLRWRVKREARLAPLAAFVGKVVDETLADALRHYHERQCWPADLHAVARRIAWEMWRFSQAWAAAIRAGREPPAGRHQPLDVHFFGEELPRAEIDRLKERIRNAVENFRTSGFPRFLQGFAPEYWRLPRAPGQPLPRFDLDGTPVWAVYDFALQTAERTWVIDWKTGAPSQGSYLTAVEQLRWYALYFSRSLGVPARKLCLVPVWLSPAALWHELEVTAEELDELAARIRERYGLVQEILRLLPGTQVPLELWPVTENVQLCGRCPFRQSCEGGRRVGEVPPPDSFEDPFAGD